MSTTIEIDDSLLRAAQEAMNIPDPAELVRKLIERELRQREAQSRLIAAGGTMPDLQIPSRDRTTPSKQ